MLLTSALNIPNIPTERGWQVMNPKISSPKMEEKVNEIYGEFDSKRRAFEAKTADEEDLRELENLIKNKNLIRFIYFFIF